MIAAEYRFRGRRDPRIVLKHGDSRRSQHLQIKYLLNRNRKPADSFRAAVLVSTKVTKNTPRRNRIRRRIYELIRQENIRPQFDLAILVFDEKLATIESELLQKELHGLLKEAGLLEK